MKKKESKEKVQVEVEKPRQVTRREVVVLESISVVKRSNELIIRSDKDFLEATELLRSNKSLQAEVEKAHDPVVSHWHQKHKEALAEKKKDMKPLLEAEETLKLRWDFWQRQQAEKQRKEEERARKEAERQEEERRQLEAAELIEEGREDEAAELLAEKVVVTEEMVAVMPMEKPVQVAGVGSVKTWSVEVDLQVLSRAVAAGNAPIEAIMADYSYLNAQARLRKKAGELYPGVRVVEGSSVRATKL